MTLVDCRTTELAHLLLCIYADDILLLAPSVTALQKLLWVCEQEVDSIDMAINAKKSSCMRIGARHEKVDLFENKHTEWPGA